MTICIAAICNLPTSPTVVFCADRLVSAGIQFTGGSSKISKITSNCVVMESSDDSLISELIMERIRRKIEPQKQYSIREIADMFRIECNQFKQEKVEADVLEKYNLVTKKLSADPNQILKEAMNEIRTYQYPFFEFIIGGLDKEGDQAHIYKIDQDGALTTWNFLGFATTGSGSQLAFAELTKWFYASQHPLSYAIPRVYFAKKVSERAQGVGTHTDFGFITYYTLKETGKPQPTVFYISTSTQMMPILDTAFQKILKNESAEIGNVQTQLDAIFQQKPPDESTTDNQQKPK